MKIKYLTAALIAVVFSSPSFSQKVCNTNGKLMLFYANGMLNSYQEAKRSASLSHLDLLRQEKAQNLDIDYQVLENTSELKDGNGPSELLEVIIQYLGYQTDFQINRFVSWYRSEPNNVDKKEESMFIDILDRFYKSTSYDQDLKRHETQYANAFNNGYKVMTIAHSQGNLYTEKAYKSFLLGNYVHGEDYTILSVGTPIVLPEKEMMLRDVKDPVAWLSDKFPIPGDIVKIDNKTIPEYVLNGEYVPKTSMPYHSYLTYLYGSDTREMIQESFSTSISKLFSDGSLKIKMTPLGPISSSIPLYYYVSETHNGYKLSGLKITSTNPNSTGMAFFPYATGKWEEPVKSSAGRTYSMSCNGYDGDVDLAVSIQHQAADDLVFEIDVSGAANGKAYSKVEPSQYEGGYRNIVKLSIGDGKLLFDPDEELEKLKEYNNEE